jgi:hypothetical protein
MRIIKIVCLISYLILFQPSSVFFAQNKIENKSEFRKKLEAANLLNTQSRFEISKTMFMELALDNPINANINYKTGHCLLKTAFMKKEALSYLIKATENISKKTYDEFDANIEFAPIYTYFYLAEAYHHNYSIDSAIKYYRFFKNVANKNNMLQSTASHYIKQCESAIKLIEEQKSYQLINIGDQINSSFADYNPTLTLDESTMYFTSRRLRSDTAQQSNNKIFSSLDGKYFEDVYVSHKDLKTDKWGKAELMSFSKPNSHQATVSISGDGEKLIIYKSETENEDTYIHYTTRESDFYRLVPLKPIHDNKLREDHVAISADSKTIYFASDDKGGMGGKDIYRVVKLPNGEWSKALNVGPPINTPYDEDSPFLHPDGKTLYYSSNNNLSMGGYDIFFSRKIDDRTWSSPENMGFPLNTVDNDLFFSTSPDGKRGYYASSHEGGLGESDIYMVQLSNSVTEPVTILKGYIDKGENNKVPQGVVIWVYDLDNDADPLQYIPNKNNGSYVFSLDPCHEYSVEYTLMNNTFYETTFKVPCESDYHEINKPITIPNISVDGEIVVIKNKEGNLSKEPSNDKISEIVKNDLINDQPSVKFNTLEQGEKSLTKLYMVDESGKILHEAVLTPSGFSFAQLPYQEDYIFMIENMPANITFEDIEIAFNNNEETVSFKANFSQSKNTIKYKIIKEDIVETNTPKIKTKNIQPYTFKVNFGYNIKSNKQEQKEVNNLLKKMEEYITSRGYVNIDVVGSASKVPTKTYRSNLEIAKLRIADAEKIMTQNYNSFNIDKNNVKIINEIPLVDGPTYTGDYYNTAKYGKYQYIKITAY